MALSKKLSKLVFITTVTFSICIGLYLGLRINLMKNVQGITFRSRSKSLSSCFVPVVTPKSSREGKYRQIFPDLLHKPQITPQSHQEDKPNFTCKGHAAFRFEEGI